jgi:hypothetical protein
VPSAKPEHEVEGRLLLDIVVRESPAIFELLTGEDEPLLVWRDALFVLDLGLDVLDRVRRLDLECDGLSGESLDKDLKCGLGFRDVWSDVRGGGTDRERGWRPAKWARRKIVVT